MSMNIDSSKCIGCSRCPEICPGNIIRLNHEGKAYLKRPLDCWHCMACIKVCPVGAISLILPPELGGRGGELTVNVRENVTKWTIRRHDGTAIEIFTDTNESNQY